MAITISGNGISSDAIASLAASKLTGQVPDANAPSGSVLQVVRAQSSGSQQALATTTFTDLNGVSLSITPVSASSKILLIGNVHGNVTQTGGGFTFKFVKNGTDIYTPLNNHQAYINNDPDWYQRIPRTYLDTAGTTSAITYKIQVATYTSKSAVFFYQAREEFASELVAMEIAA